MNWRIPAMIWERILKVLRDSSLERIRNGMKAYSFCMCSQKVFFVLENKYDFAVSTDFGRGNVTVIVVVMTFAQLVLNGC
jgi:hypothetical protein